MISCSDRRFAVIGWLLSCVIGIDQRIAGEHVPLTDSDLIQFSPVILNPKVTDDPTPTGTTLRLDASIEFLFTKAVGVGSRISAMAVFGFWVTVNNKCICHEKEKKEEVLWLLWRSASGGETSLSCVFHWGRPAGGVSKTLQRAAWLTCEVGGFAVWCAGRGPVWGHQAGASDGPPGRLPGWSPYRPGHNTTQSAKSNEAEKTGLLHCLSGWFHTWADWWRRPEIKGWTYVNTTIAFCRGMKQPSRHQSRLNSIPTLEWHVCSDQQPEEVALTYSA